MGAYVIGWVLMCLNVRTERAYNRRECVLNVNCRGERRRRRWRRRHGRRRACLYDYCYTCAYTNIPGR